MVLSYIVYAHQCYLSDGLLPFILPALLYSPPVGPIQLDCSRSEECCALIYSCAATGGVGNIGYSCDVDGTSCESIKHL